jgi:hypothetical protein
MRESERFPFFDLTRIEVACSNVCVSLLFFFTKINPPSHPSSEKQKATHVDEENALLTLDFYSQHWTQNNNAHTCHQFAYRQMRHYRWEPIKTHTRQKISGF